MKNAYLILAIIVAMIPFKLKAQCGGAQIKSAKPTSIGIVIYSNDAETVWNALRFANYTISAGDTVSIFLLGKGVELNTMNDKKFDLKEQTDNYLKNGGNTWLAALVCKAEIFQIQKAARYHQ